MLSHLIVSSRFVKRARYASARSIAHTMNQPVDVKDGSTTTAAAAATHALLTPPQRQVLLALADALFPVPDAHDGDDTTAVDLDDPVFSTSVHTHPETVAFMEQQLVALVPPAMLPSILLLFTALSTTAGTVMLALPGALWEGRVPSMRAFPQLTATERRRVLLAWSKSWVPQLRALPRALYNLTAMAMLGKTVGGTRTNPFWKAMDYDAPTTAPVCTDVDGDKDDDKNDVDDDDDTEDVDDDDDKNDVNVNDNDTPSPHYDAIIIGSGIGGGVMADALAAAGFNVLVCEKGKRFRRKELSMYEEDAYARMFENGGLVGSEDGAVNFLAGATFGGGMLW